LIEFCTAQGSTPSLAAMSFRKLPSNTLVSRRFPDHRYGGGARAGNRTNQRAGADGRNPEAARYATDQRQNPDDEALRDAGTA
jgi:hypothetical protein